MKKKKTLKKKPRIETGYNDANSTPKEIGSAQYV
jgi:hypothetical protein